MCRSDPLAARGGEWTGTPATEGIESAMIGGIANEAFNTSSGFGTLTETLAGRVRDLSDKMLRYPGRAEIMKLLPRCSPARTWS